MLHFLIRVAGLTACWQKDFASAPSFSEAQQQGAEHHDPGRPLPSSPQKSTALKQGSLPTKEAPIADTHLIRRILPDVSPSKLIIALLSCIILASLASTLATAFILRHMAPALPTPPPMISSTVPHSAVAPDSWQPIISRNLFNLDGEVADEEPATPLKRNSQGDIIATSLPFKLLGTVYGSDPYNGVAMIEDTNQKSKNSFVVGDRLSDGVLLHQVLRKRVILNNRGQLEYLLLKDPEIKRRSRDGASSPLSHMSPLVERQPVAHSTGRLSQFKEEGYEFTGDKIFMTENYKKKLLTQDFSKVLQDAKADPYMVGGKLTGFILTRIRKDSIYEKSGFANGDIIKEINGIELTSASQAIGVLQAARNARRLEVTVVQNGETKIIEVNIGQ